MNSLPDGLPADAFESAQGSGCIAFYKELLSGVSEAIIALNRDFEICYWNAAASKLFGMEFLQDSGAHIRERLLLGSGKSPLHDALPSLLKNGSWSGELVYRRTRHAVRTIETHARVLRDAHGGFGGIVSSSRDITRRKTDEARIAFQARLLEEVRDAIISTDMDMKITSWNRAAEDCYGWLAAEALGKNANILLQTVYVRSNQAQARNDLDKSGTAELELIHTRKDGEKVCIISRVSLIHAEDGSPLGILGVHTDITEKKRQAQALQETERKYQELVRHAPAGIYEADFQTNRFISVNDAMSRISGYSRDELFSMRLTDFLDAPSRSMYLRRAAQWLSGSKPEMSTDYRVIAKDGKPIDILLNVIYTRDETGQPLGATGIIHDITERKRAEKALQESEQKYQDLVQHAPAGIYEIDFATARYVSVNDVMCEWTGYSREELLQMRPYDMLGLPSVEEITETGVRWRSGQLPDSSMEFKAYTKDGREIYALLHGKLQTDESGRPTGVTVIAHNITEHKKAQAALRQSEQRYQEMVKHAPSGIYEVDIRRQCFNTVNDTMCRLTGYTREEFLTMDPQNLLSEKSREIFENRNRLLLSGVKPITCVDYEVVKKDGGILYALLDVNYTLDEAGAPIGATVIAQDITERKLAEAALRQSEERLREQAVILQAINRVYEQAMATESVEQLGAACLKIIEDVTQSTIGFMGQIGADGRLRDIAVSAAALTACGAGQTTGHARMTGKSSIKSLCGSVLASRRSVLENTLDTPPQDTWLPDEHPALSCFLGVPFLQGGKAVGMIGVANRPGGYGEKERAMLEALTPTVLEALMRARAEEALQERETQARTLAQALEKKNSLITDFFINISHEFKTPLTILMLGVELLEKKIEPLRGDGQADKNLAVMKQNCYRLSRLVSNLLDITKLDAGFMEPAWELRNIVDWLAILVKSTDFYARQKGLELTFTCNVAEKEMYIDGFMLDRIMLNLLSNAIKHTPAGGRISVDCQADEVGVVIRVRDTGEGIPLDKQAIIFDRFSQVNTSLTRGSEGTGIGLALTKSLVDLMGGKVWFSSEPGRGSEFSVSLPAVQRNGVRRSVEQVGLKLEKRVRMELSDIT